MAINQVFIKLNINSSPANTTTEATTTKTVSDSTPLGQVMDLLGSLEDVVQNMEATENG